MAELAYKVSDYEKKSTKSIEEEIDQWCDQFFPRPGAAQCPPSQNPKLLLLEIPFFICFSGLAASDMESSVLEKSQVATLTLLTLSFMVGEVAHFLPTVTRSNLISFVSY